MDVNHIIKTKPYKHQIDALDKAKDMGLFGFFMEMGTGKSKVLIDNIAWLRHEKKNKFCINTSSKRCLS